MQQRHSDARALCRDGSRRNLRAVFLSRNRAHLPGSGRARVDIRRVERALHRYGAHLHVHRRRFATPRGRKFYRAPSSFRRRPSGPKVGWEAFSSKAMVDLRKRYLHFRARRGHDRHPHCDPGSRLDVRRLERSLHGDGCDVHVHHGGGRALPVRYGKLPRPRILFVERRSIEGGSGSIRVDPPNESCEFSNCRYEYPAGTLVTLTATAEPDSIFSGWTGACTGSALTCEITLEASVPGVFAEASFTGPRYLDVTIQATRDGRGSVFVDPPGAVCDNITGVGLCQYAYRPATVVTLAASATWARCSRAGRVDASAPIPLARSC